MGNKNILQIVAERNGVSVEQAEREIQVAVAEGVRNSQLSDNEKAMGIWDAIKNGAGECDTTELINYLAAIAFLEQ